jgi:hypothetical protein
MDLTGLGSIAELAKGIIDKIWPPAADPNKKLEAQLELQQMLEDRENAVIVAQKEIIVSEMQQADNFTKRARPSVVYAGLAFIFFDHVALPIYSFFSHGTVPDVSLPAEFWWAWTGCVGIWMVGRTLEKRGSTSDLIAKITGGK